MLHIPTDNGPYAVEPTATLALAHARKLRGLRIGFCLSPDDSDGWYAVPGKSGGLTVLQIDAEPSRSLKLPPPPATWTVLLPQFDIRQLWFTPPFTGHGELQTGQYARAGVRVLHLAPLPGTRHNTGQRYEWDRDLNPWTMPAPAILPLAWWSALPKQPETKDFVYSRARAHMPSY